MTSALLARLFPNYLWQFARDLTFLCRFGEFLGPVAGAEWSGESGPKSKNGVEEGENRNSSRVRADHASATVYFCNYMDPTPHGCGGISRCAVGEIFRKFHTLQTHWSP